MLLQTLLGLLSRLWPYLLLALVSLRMLYNRYGHGISRYPGPFWASITDLFMVFEAYRDYNRVPLRELHDNYGDIVRWGPNKLSFGDPTAIKDILGPGKDFRKSEVYSAAAATANGRSAPSLFSTLDKEYHDRIKRAINHAFSTTSLVDYEPYVNHVIDTFLKQLKSRFVDESRNEVFNLSTWLHYYALDVIGEVVYGEQYGFLNTATDVDNMQRDTQAMQTYMHMVGQAPWLDRVFWKNPVWLWMARRGWIGSRTNPAVISARKAQSARLGYENPSGAGDVEKATEKETHTDLLDRFIKAKEAHPESLGNNEILMLGISMVFAGADTTAWTLSAFFYYVLRTPGVYEQLSKEILSSSEAELMPYNRAQKLAYLDACIKETFRMHPAARFGSERVVPAGGATICGEQIPEGTIVAINPWVLHRRKDIWGEDVDVYRPERWLEDEAKAKKMGGLLFQFGAGNFMCIGKNISMLEMYKVTVALLNRFDFEMLEPEKEWKLMAGGFARPEEVMVRIRERSQTAS